ncbi:MAG TPA: 23S rRNA (adenine(2030)-N(6))-methyltransferase RlmJ [Steroidobacteraceae bacterium]|nr:23S rRNA (adenine(2030)-N(6))-methyltransferase RlmJ [Steroidobacteraceae bacterium]
MKYRHACHAGNFADVVKHVTLVAAILRLAQKDRPLFLLETHAGRGRYDLASQGGGAEAAAGIRRLAAANLPSASTAIARYLAIVRQFNPPGAPPACYPGSPLIAGALLRPQDRAAFCEIVATEAELLRREFRRDARVGVHCRDGFEALRALLPPREKRGLVLIDPPYEETGADFARVAEALAQASGRWPQGSLIAWYPIKQGVIAARFHRQLAEAGLERLLVAELCIHPDDSRVGLNGSGLVIVNPPYRLDQDLEAALPALHRVLSPAGAGRTRVAPIAGA